VTSNNGKKILFIDDDKYYLDSFKRLIAQEKFPWLVKTCESADEAMALDDLNAFDVILTDINMPVHDGFWVLDQLQANPETMDIPAIVLTGSDQESYKRLALQKGASDLLNKPISPQDLFARIFSSLKIKEYQDQLKNQNVLLEKEVLKRTAQLEFSRMEIIWKLAHAAEFRDESTGEHVIRVGYFSKILAENLGMTENDCHLIFLTSPLHDIGKIGIPDQIMLKRFSLSEREMDMMKMHCEYGSRILLERSTQELRSLQQLRNLNTFPLDEISLENPFLEKAAEIALSHHENWDGSGYPYHKMGQEIPLFGRIVAVADMYDALRSKRPYKEALSPAESMELIQKSSGKKTDPEIVSVCMKQSRHFEEIWNTFKDS
jgi:putative two-component system response regulator